MDLTEVTEHHPGAAGHTAVLATCAHSRGQRTWRAVNEGSINLASKFITCIKIMSNASSIIPAQNKVKLQ